MTISAYKEGLRDMADHLGSEGAGLLAAYGLLLEFGRMVESAKDETKLADNAAKFRAVMVKFREQYGTGTRAAAGATQIADAYLALIDAQGR